MTQDVLNCLAPIVHKDWSKYRVAGLAISAESERRKDLLKGLKRKKKREAMDTKNRAWEELMSTVYPRPNGMTQKRLKKIKSIVWSDENFWSDLLDRHGLRAKKLSELDVAIRDHAIGNFWGMLAQTMHAEFSGIKR